MKEENQIADNTEDTPKHRRRSTDNIDIEKVLPSTKSNRWSSVLNGLGLAFLLSVAVTIGAYLKQVDSNVKDIDVAEIERKELMLQIKDMVAALHVSNVLLEERDKQQTESDKRFEKKFDESNSNLERVIDKLDTHDKQIFLINQKISVVDKLFVYELAMR